VASVSRTFAILSAAELFCHYRYNSKFFARSVRLALPCLSSIYGESGRQAINMAELQDGIRKPEEFAKMQSPGEGRLMKFFRCGGTATPALCAGHRRVWGGNLNKIDQGSK